MAGTTIAARSRLRRLEHQLGAGPAPTAQHAAAESVIIADRPAPEAAAPLQAPPVLLSDADVKRFLVDGALALPLTDLPVDFHRSLQAQSRAGFEQLQAEGLEDRYVYERLPEMGAVLGSPLLRGALVSLLGPGYCQHPHRSMHVQGNIDDGAPRLGDGGWVSSRAVRRLLVIF